MSYPSTTGLFHHIFASTQSPSPQSSTSHHEPSPHKKDVHTNGLPCPPEHIPLHDPRPPPPHPQSHPPAPHLTQTSPSNSRPLFTVTVSLGKMSAPIALISGGISVSLPVLSGTITGSALTVPLWAGFAHPVRLRPLSYIPPVRALWVYSKNLALSCSFSFPCHRSHRRQLALCWRQKNRSYTTTQPTKISLIDAYGTTAAAGEAFTLHEEGVGGLSEQVRRVVRSPPPLRLPSPRHPLIHCICFPFLSFAYPFLCPPYLLSPHSSPSSQLHSITFFALARRCC